MILSTTANDLNYSLDEIKSFINKNVTPIWIIVFLLIIVIAKPSISIMKDLIKNDMKKSFQKAIKKWWNKIRR